MYMTCPYDISIWQLETTIKQIPWTHPQDKLPPDSVQSWTDSRVSLGDPTTTAVPEKQGPTEENLKVNERLMFYMWFFHGMFWSHFWGVFESWLKKTRGIMVSICTSIPLLVYSGHYYVDIWPNQCHRTCSMLRPIILKHWSRCMRWWFKSCDLGFQQIIHSINTQLGVNSDSTCYETAVGMNPIIATDLPNPKTNLYKFSLFSNLNWNLCYERISFVFTLESYKRCGSPKIHRLGRLLLSCFDQLFRRHSWILTVAVDVKEHLRKTSTQLSRYGCFQK